jgi:glutathione S-transferase
MITLYGRETSINVQKVAWTLGELALEVDWVGRDGKVGDVGVENYEKLNATRRVPTLVDDGLTLTQSNSIVRYLAATYGSGLWPEDPGERAASDRWMEWQSTDVWVDMTPTFWGLIRTPPEDRDMTAIGRHVENLAAHFQILDDHLKTRAYVGGDRLTMGDIPIGTGIYRYMSLPIERPSLPHVEAWYARLQEREPYRTYVIVPLS